MRNVRPEGQASNRPVFPAPFREVKGEGCSRFLKSAFSVQRRAPGSASTLRACVLHIVHYECSCIGLLMPGWLTVLAQRKGDLKTREGPSGFMRLCSHHIMQASYIYQSQPVLAAPSGSSALHDRCRVPYPIVYQNHHTAMQNRYAMSQCWLRARQFSSTESSLLPNVAPMICTSTSRCYFHDDLRFQ